MQFSTMVALIKYQVGNKDSEILSGTEFHWSIRVKLQEIRWYRNCSQKLVKWERYLQPKDDLRAHSSELLQPAGTWDLPTEGLSRWQEEAPITRASPPIQEWSLSAWLTTYLWGTFWDCLVMGGNKKRGRDRETETHREATRLLPQCRGGTHCCGHCVGYTQISPPGSCLSYPWGQVLVTGAEMGQMVRLGWTDPGKSPQKSSMDPDLSWFWLSSTCLIFTSFNLVAPQKEF